jgi:hypothetical protein
MNTDDLNANQICCVMKRKEEHKTVAQENKQES